MIRFFFVLKKHKQIAKIEKNKLSLVNVNFQLIQIV